MLMKARLFLSTCSLAACFAKHSLPEIPAGDAEVPHLSTPDLDTALSPEGSAADATLPQTQARPQPPTGHLL